MSVDNRANGTFSFSKAVDMAKNERSNNDSLQSGIKYNDGFNDFTRYDGFDHTEVRASEKETPYFLPIREDSPSISGMEDRREVFVTEYDFTDAENDSDLDMEVDPGEEPDIPFARTEEAENFFDEFMQEEKTETFPLFARREDETAGGLSDADFGVFFDDDTEDEIDFELPEEREQRDFAEEEESGFGEDEFFEKEFNGRGKNAKGILLICAIAAAVIMVFVVAVWLTISSIIGNGTIYDGVMINGYSLAGMSKEEVAAYVRKNYFEPINNAHITVSLGETSKVYALTNFVVCPDAEAIAEEAYSVARTGGKLERVREILALRRNPKTILIEYTVVDDKLSEITESATDISFSEPVNPTYEIKNDVVVFTSGRHGTSIDLEKFRSDLYASLNAFENAIASLGENVGIPNMEVEIDTRIVEFKILIAQEIYDAAYKPSENAYFYRTGSGEIAVHDHVPERKLDIEALNAMVSKINMGETIPYAELPYVYTDPSVSTSFLKARLYPDTLNQTSSINRADLFSTDAEKGIEERMENIRKAAERFGTVTLMSGESVRFSDRIGSVDGAAGYVNAYENLYDEGKKIMGGGISQAASALYTAALKSGLEISEHHNNTYYPNFGLVGFDAYVGDGKDLVIKNNREYPVSITISCTDNTVTVTIKGVSSGSQAVMLNVVEESNELISGGNRLVYSVNKSQGYSKTELGKVTYLRLSDDPLLPSETDDPVTETPDIPDTADPSESPDTESPDTATPGQDTASPSDSTAEPTDPSDSPGNTPEPAGPTETPAPNPEVPEP